MHETYGTCVDDEWFDIYDVDTDHDTDDDTNDDTDDDTDMVGAGTCIFIKNQSSRIKDQGPRLKAQGSRFKSQG